MRFGFVVLLCCSLVNPVVADAVPEFERVNRERARAGLPALVGDATLTDASARHAAYLDRYREPGGTGQGVSAHVQQPGLDGFSGEGPAERALAAGYPHREVRENVSMGFDDADSAIDGLMAGIYHRLTFLDLQADRLGVARGERSRVFLLGRSDLVELCRAPPDAALSLAPVNCLGRSVRREHYETLCDALPAEALFRPSHPVACPDGTRLDAAFMRGVCDDPPAAARFGGHGRYYAACENGTRLDAAWFDALCGSRPAQAMASGDGHFYAICDGQRQVRAEWLEAWCAALPASALYRDSGLFRRPCANDADIRVEYLDALDAQRHAALPAVVRWPPDGAYQVPPAFFIEQPDPLPDLGVAGYPVSIQFNPASAANIEIGRFELFRVDTPEPLRIDATRRLDHHSDPNGLLDEYEFALFPLRRLDWQARYRAVVEARVDGVDQRHAWTFSTGGDGLALLTADRPRQRFVVQSGRDYLLYLPPDGEHDVTVSTVHTTHQRGNRVTVTPVDPNTLKVRVDARVCDHVVLRFDTGRRVILSLSGCSS